MDAIGNALPVVIKSAPVAAPAPAVPSPAPAPSAPPVILPGSGATAGEATFDAKAAEQVRAATVQQVSQGSVNVFVVSDRQFTIFKDATGQYITRFTSLRDGKVTYVPEPTLIKQTRPPAGAAVNIRV